MQLVMISSCLLGEPVRYNGQSCACDHPILARWRAEGRVLPVCPELEGGLAVPRPPAEIEAGRGGPSVLQGTARVLGADGGDCTAGFLRGAGQAVALAQRHGIRVAVLKEGSPSCGSGAIHDGGFRGTRIPGQGVAAARLRQAGVSVFSEEQWEEAAACLARLGG